MGQIFSCCEIEKPTIVHHKRKASIFHQENSVSDMFEDIIQKRYAQKKKYYLDNFQIDGKIGEGAFGTVYQVQFKQNIAEGKNQLYAMKQIKKKKLIQNGAMKSVSKEKEIMAILNNKFLVNLRVAFQDYLNLYLIMQIAIGGDTYQLIKKKNPQHHEFKKLGVPALKFLFGCIILGLEYLHKEDILYRDLKPENVVLFGDGYAKLTDFGLAKRNLNNENFKNEKAGTLLYYAPEMMMNQGYNKNIDLWTLGVYMYEMAVFQPPFRGQSIQSIAFKDIVISSQHDRDWKGAELSNQLKDLINGLLRYDQNRRLGANGQWGEIKNHPFFHDFCWQQLDNGSMQSPLKQLVAKHPIILGSFNLDKKKNQTNQNLQFIKQWTLVKYSLTK